MNEITKMRPRQFAELRRETPVAYFGLGILEWHGVHNPLGLDGVKANAVACYLAKRLGGVVLPPLFWGDDRSEICELVFDPSVSSWLPAGTMDHTREICSILDIKKDDIIENGKRSLKEGEWKLWEDLMIHNLFQIQTLGFRLTVVIPGHYPLFSPVKKAVESYVMQGGSMKVFSLQDNMYSLNLDAGDHAAAFETSLMLALEPDLVDLRELDSDLSRPNIGVLGKDPRVYANKSFGMDILERFEVLVKEQFKSADIKTKPFSSAISTVV